MRFQRCELQISYVCVHVYSCLCVWVRVGRGEEGERGGKRDGGEGREEGREEGGEGENGE